jgi:hypothetical protein
VIIVEKMKVSAIVPSSVADPGHFGTDPYPCLWLIDPDLAIFVFDVQDANKKLIKQSISAYYFLKVPDIHLHHFSKKKCPKEVT